MLFFLALIVEAFSQESECIEPLALFWLQPLSEQQFLQKSFALFFRLRCQQRGFVRNFVQIVDAGLSYGLLSFAHFAQALEMECSEFEKLLWSCKLELASQENFTWPIQKGISSENCPEVDPLRPWYQRYAARQAPSSTLFFLEHHLKYCSPCLDSFQSHHALELKLSQSFQKVPPSKTTMEKLQKLFQKAPRKKRVLMRFSTFMEDPLWIAGILGGLGILLKCLL